MGRTVTEVKLDISTWEDYVHPLAYTLTGETIGFCLPNGVYCVTGDLIKEQTYCGRRVGQPTKHGPIKAFFQHRRPNYGIAIQYESAQVNRISWNPLESEDPAS